MIENAELQAIHLRLIRVEKQNRRFRCIMVLAAIALGFVATIPKAQSVDREVAAEKFVVKDSNGRTLAEMSGGGIVFHDTKGNARIRIGELSNFSSGIVSNTPGIGLYDEGGQRKIVLMSTGRAMELKFETGETGAVLSVNQSGPSLTLSDNEGFQTTAGAGAVMDRRVGEIVKTNAASLVLARDSRVLWRAP